MLDDGKTRACTACLLSLLEFGLGCTLGGTAASSTSIYIAIAIRSAALIATVTLPCNSMNSQPPRSKSSPSSTHHELSLFSYLYSQPPHPSLALNQAHAVFIFYTIAFRIHHVNCIPSPTQPCESFFASNTRHHCNSYLQRPPSTNNKKSCSILCSLSVAVLKSWVLYCLLLRI